MSTDEAFTVTNRLSSERPQVVAKDLAAPSQPLSAYAMFFKETQASIKSEQPDATFDVLKKIVETMWQVLGEEQKKKYEERSNQDKERYDRELAQYNAAREEQQRQIAAASSVIKSAPPSSGQPIKPLNTPTPVSGQQCIRLGCTKPSIRNVEWEDEYCSTQCVVLHCDFVFREWVREQQSKA